MLNESPKAPQFTDWGASGFRSVVHVTLVTPSDPGSESIFHFGPRTT